MLFLSGVEEFRLKVKPFRYSIQYRIIRDRRTDRQTDRQTDAFRHCKYCAYA